MPVNILMPALSPTMEKGNLAKWLKKEGDAVKAGDVIAEIETDKATMEYESIDDGVLAKIVVPEGSQDVPVNQLIAVLAQEGEDPKAAASAAAAAGKGARAAAAPAPAPAAPAAKSETAARPAVAPAAPSAPAAVPANGGNRVFASPLARRLAKTANIELNRIRGSGPHGRIIARDVEAARSGQGLVPAAAASFALPVPSDDKIRALFELGSYDVIPHDNIRKVIARRLVEAKLTIPHFYLTLDCNIGKLLAAREEINTAAPKDKDGKPAYKLSVNDFVIKALALALQRIPNANVTWTESGMLKHHRSDIGVAVSIPGGLITPVVTGADTKSLSAIATEIKDLAARAKDGKLKPEEYAGGTASISNMGMYGIKQFEAVINPPQGMIMAIGAGEKRPYVVNDSLQIATVMSATGSFDHRAIDGADGARLMQAFKRLVENPLGMLA